MTTATELARAFAKQIQQDLTADQLVLVAARNRAEADPNICHSHDFIDANQSMIDAIEALDLDWQDMMDNHTNTMNEAWNIAKSAGFNADKIS